MFQKCLVELVVPPLDQYGVVITPKNIEMKGQTVLTQYIVPHWQLRYMNESELMKIERIFLILIFR